MKFFNEKLRISFEFYFSFCKCVRSCIKYSTKEDFDCLFKGIDCSQFHLNYHIYYWAMSTEKYSILDPFVQKNIFYANYIELMFTNFKCKKQSKDRLVLLRVLKKFFNWRDEVVNWYNEFISGKTLKALYLFGKADSGKTSFIYSIFGKCLLN